MAQRTRIAHVRITPLAFPDPPLLNSGGVHQPWALRSLVEIELADGTVGLAEGYGDQGYLRQLQQCAGELIGTSILDRATLERAAERIAGEELIGGLDRHVSTGELSRQNPAARLVAPFDVAMNDLHGKLVNAPVYDVLGGAHRRSIPFAGYLFYKWASHRDSEPDKWGEAIDPAGIVAQAQAFIDAYGFGSLKLKGGVFAPDDEIAAIRALHVAFPDLPLRMDPNAAWTVQTSIRVAEETEGMLEYLEDPTPGRQGMAQVAKAVTMPLATNMCVVDFPHLPEAVALGSVQIVLADHHYWGGLARSLELARISQTWGMAMSMHSNSHLGISLAAMTHLAAATPHLDYAVDTHTPWQMGMDVVTEPLTITQGAVQVPATPGLGVSLDQDKVDELHENYLRCGIVERDDAAYMSEYDPNYRKIRPRW